MGPPQPSGDKHRCLQEECIWVGGENDGIILERTPGLLCVSLPVAHRDWGPPAWPTSWLSRREHKPQASSQSASSGLNSQEFSCLLMSGVFAMSWGHFLLLLDSTVLEVRIQVRLMAVSPPYPAVSHGAQRTRAQDLGAGCWVLGAGHSDDPTKPC